MIRKIIKISEDLCNGCNLCVNACHEGAIGLVDGKARLLRDDYCDGLGNCLPVCPTGAITFEEREADAFDEEAVAVAMKEKNKNDEKTLACGCPGSHATTIVRDERNEAGTSESVNGIGREGENERESKKENENWNKGETRSELRQWPVQIKLVPVNAPYLNGAHLLVAADCTAYAYANFHHDFIKGKITLIGCPKLDEGDYSEKLTEILKLNDIKSITIVRMEVPCCTGIENAVKTALKNSGEIIPWQCKVVSVEGKVLE